MKLTGLSLPAVIGLSGFAFTSTHPQAQAGASYEDIAPLPGQRCVLCHAGESAPLGLRLDSYFATRCAKYHTENDLVGPAPEGFRLTSYESTLSAVDRARVVPVGAEARLHGTLEARWRLDGLELSVDSSARIDKSPGSGDYVEVRGHLDASGKVIAERIRRRQ